MAQAAMPSSSYEAPVAGVKRWPSERPLWILVVLIAIVVWIALAVSVIGIAYVLLIGLVLFFAHVGFITHLRGNGVRLGPDQMPELYRRVHELSSRLGMRHAPDAYVIQAGGALNALATRFLGKNFIVLFSDLLDACGDDDGARDFIVAHELGHLAAGHLRARWLLLPGLAFPFLGTAYSRACEYTSDRYGVAVAADRGAALNGLCILAAGGKHGPHINRRALAAQRRDLATPWMKIGQWLGTHPPIAHRLQVLEPGLVDRRPSELGARLGALAILALLVIVPTAIGVAAVKGAWPKIQEAIQKGQQAQQQAAAQAAAAAAPSVGAPAVPDEARMQLVREHILGLAAVADHVTRATGTPPADVAALYELWRAANPGAEDPLDPFDGQWYGYHAEAGEFLILSDGADPESREDDLYYSSAQAKAAAAQAQ
jgi:Zn-dependent protease with chaperone function